MARLFREVPVVIAENNLHQSVSERQVQVIMGTLVEVQLPHSEETYNSPSFAMKAAFDAVREVDRKMSVYKPDSEISGVNQNAGRGFSPVSPETYFVLREALRMGQLTEGCFDITAGPLAELWGFHREELGPGPIPQPWVIEEVRSRVGHCMALLEDRSYSVALQKEGAKIDLGGIAKGFAIDRAIETLRDYGIQNTLVSAGGDLFCLGKPTPHRLWRIGLKHPLKKNDIIAKLNLSNQAVATSGTYANFFLERRKRWGHIIDPRTGYAVQTSLLSVTVVASQCWLADALATAFIVSGKEKAMDIVGRLKDVEVVFVEEKGGKIDVSYTKGLQDRIFLEEV